MAFVTLDIKKLKSNFNYLNTIFKKNGKDEIIDGDKITVDVVDNNIVLKKS